MIPIALVTGFLGSGKTSLLQHVVDRNRDRRLVYLVNEFSPLDVDGQVLEIEPDRLVVISGGSIFCRCLVTDFISQLERIARDQGDGIEGVIIEASGIANPKVVAQMLAETRLDRQFHLATVIAVVDPDSFHDLLETLPSIRAQIEAADLVIVNKVDLHTAERLDATEAELRRINPEVGIVRATYCRISVDLLVPARRGELRGEYAACADPNYSRIVVRPADDIDLHRLAAALEPLKDSVYRIKGFIRSGGRMHYLDVSRAGITTRPAGRADADPGLACICPPNAVPGLKRLLEQIESGALKSAGSDL